jgi:hypothetical protein
MSPPCSPPWECSSSPLVLWVCGGNLVQSLYVWSLLKSIWCVLHDYGTIYVFLWCIFCYEMIFLMHLLLCWDLMVCHTLQLHLWYM